MFKSLFKCTVTWVLVRLFCLSFFHSILHEEKALHGINYIHFISELQWYLFMKMIKNMQINYDDQDNVALKTL